MSESLRGTFETTVLATLATLPQGASGLDLRSALTDRTGRAPAVGAVYTVLQRLEAKGFVIARVDEPRAIRGGRARRLFTISGAGVQALEAFRRRADLAWEFCHRSLSDASPLCDETAVCRRGHHALRG